MWSFLHCAASISSIYHTILFPLFSRRISLDIICARNTFTKLTYCILTSLLLNSCSTHLGDSAEEKRCLLSSVARVVNTEVNQGKANRFSVTHETDMRNAYQSVSGVVEETVNRGLNDRYNLNCTCFSKKFYSILNMHIAGSSETVVPVYQTTRCPSQEIMNKVHLKRPRQNIC